MRQIACTQCGKTLALTYAQSKSRLMQPHYCSKECRDLAWASRAKERLAGRFWPKVMKHDSVVECWPWTGRRDHNGYGRFDWERRPQLAHRLSFELSIGPVPDCMCVCHSCDNPQCCNPWHLWLGDDKDNMADMAKKGRASRNGKDRHGDTHPSSIINSSDAIAIYCSDENVKTLAERYGITPQAIYLIKKGKNWRHVTHAQGILDTNESPGLSTGQREVRSLRLQTDDSQA